MAASALPPPSNFSSNDLPVLNSYGSLSRADDIEVLPSTTILQPSNTDVDQSNTAISPRYRSAKAPCLKPHQSETVFALFLFLLGLSLLIYVIVSYWFTHSQISPIIVCICGLLCFIPGCYYLLDRYCFCHSCKRNRLRRLPILEQDDII